MGFFPNEKKRRAVAAATLCSLLLSYAPPTFGQELTDPTPLPEVASENVVVPDVIETTAPSTPEMPDPLPEIVPPTEEVPIGVPEVDPIVPIPEPVQVEALQPSEPSEEAQKKTIEEPEMNAMSSSPPPA